MTARSGPGPRSIRLPSDVTQPHPWRSTSRTGCRRQGDSGPPDGVSGGVGGELCWRPFRGVGRRAQGLARPMVPVVEDRMEPKVQRSRAPRRRFDAMVAELVEYRLSRYLTGKEAAAEDAWIVAVARRWPAHSLLRREPAAGLPEGTNSCGRGP